MNCITCPHYKDCQRLIASNQPVKCESLLPWEIANRPPPPPLRSKLPNTQWPLRRNQILKIIDSAGRITSSQLADRTGAKIDTVRRWLARLTREGTLITSASKKFAEKAYYLKQ